ncbi:MAG: helix-turn-helix transcriptional regulator [Candidatus Hodarchaeaceae archaeon]|nr:helix-turn-helix transcriptional regulator [Candidatus Hodarchaeaceae archaeon]
MKYRFDGLAEFVSRRGRVMLLQLVLDSGMTQNEVAVYLSVTQQAVSKWLNPRETHPCNKNLRRLLKLAWEISPRGSLEVLKHEHDTFSELFRSFANSKH